MLRKTIYLFSFLLFWAAVFLKAETRKWTSSSGTSMNAELIDFSNRIVILKSSAGKKITLTIDQLIPSDQNFVQNWAAQKNNLSKKTISSKKKGGENKVALSAGMTDLLPFKLLDSNGKEVSSEMLAGKMVGFYFSAHWCPPCRGFTPSLVDFRDKNKKDFEVVFVSSDKSPDAQMNYMKEMKMKWYTLPHRSDEANKLSKKYGVRGIPALIIVSPEGKTISKNGRSEVGSNPKESIEIWKKSS